MRCNRHRCSQCCEPVPTHYVRSPSIPCHGSQISNLRNISTRRFQAEIDLGATRRGDGIPRRRPDVTNSADLRLCLPMLRIVPVSHPLPKLEYRQASHGDCCGLEGATGFPATLLHGTSSRRILHLPACALRCEPARLPRAEPARLPRADPAPPERCLNSPVRPRVARDALVYPPTACSLFGALGSCSAGTAAAEKAAADAIRAKRCSSIGQTLSGLFTSKRKKEEQAAKAELARKAAIKAAKAKLRAEKRAETKLKEVVEEAEFRDGYRVNPRPAVTLTVPKRPPPLDAAQQKLRDEQNQQATAEIASNLTKYIKILKDVSLFSEMGKGEHEVAAQGASSPRACVAPWAAEGSDEGGVWRRGRVWGRGHSGAN